MRRHSPIYLCRRMSVALQGLCACIESLGLGGSSGWQQCGSCMPRIALSRARLPTRLAPLLQDAALLLCRTSEDDSTNPSTGLAVGMY